MPCQSDPFQDYSELKDVADAATRAACEMAKILRRQGMVYQLNSETKQWIKAHAKKDREREELEEADRTRERVRRKALSKLSREERQSLNL